MPLTKKQSTTMWVLTVLLAALFGFAGGSKLLGAPEAVEGFANLGLPAWFRILVGIIEVAGAIGLLIPRFAIEAASFLVVLMVGALITCIAAGENFLPPIATAILLAAVTWLRSEE